jgi:predicted PolB exonuclease-like 3'-5' exonuclease
MPKPILVYDIETIPDYAAIARAHHLSEDDIEGAKRALGENFPKPIFHSIVAIGMIWATYECDKSWRIREVSVPHIGQMSEKQLIETFVTTVAQTLPILVSYNGSAFDLPVIRHRALLNHVAGKALGAYPGYSKRHSEVNWDLLDMLSGGSARNVLKLDQVCAALGLIGKTEGMDGGRVADLAAAGQYDEIASYCAGDIAATFRLFATLEIFCNRLSEPAFQTSMESLEIGLATFRRQQTISKMMNLPF